MKKILSIGILSLAMTAISTTEAPAWLNWKIGIGANMGWQSGGNNTLWGFFRNGQPPAPDFCGGGFGGPGMAPGLPGYPGPGPGPLPGPVSAPQTYYQPDPSNVNANADAAAGVPARTQSYRQYPWNAQTANYQYPYSYPYYPSYYNYGYSYYGYGR